MRKREQDRLVGRSGRQPQPPNRAGTGGPSKVGREPGWAVLRWWRWRWTDTWVTVWCAVAVVGMWWQGERLLTNILCTVLLVLVWSVNVVLALISWWTRRRDVRVFRRG